MSRYALLLLLSLCSREHRWDTNPVIMKYGHSLTKIHYNNEGNTITATFANGVTETGTLLIGADGPRSCVRSLLLGEEAAAATPLENIVHTNFTYCPGDAKKALFLRSAHPAWSLCLNPEMFMLLSSKSCFFLLSCLPTLWLNFTDGGDSSRHTIAYFPRDLVFPTLVRLDRSPLFLP